jgi:hypothetical protein
MLGDPEQWSKSMTVSSACPTRRLPSCPIAGQLGPGQDGLSGSCHPGWSHRVGWAKMSTAGLGGLGSIRVSLGGRPHSGPVHGCFLSVW